MEYQADIKIHMRGIMTPENYQRKKSQANMLSENYSNYKHIYICIEMYIL